MGSLFQSPRLTRQSSVDDLQSNLWQPLSRYLGGQIGQTSPYASAAMGLVSGTNPWGNSLYQGLSGSAVGQATSDWSRFTLPALNGEFARYGGTLSSRRGTALAQSLEGTQRAAESQVTGLLPQILGTQLSGINAAGSLSNLPLEMALRFALQPTYVAGQQPAGPGWGILGDVLGAGATLGAASFMGPQGVRL